MPGRRLKLSAWLRREQGACENARMTDAAQPSARRNNRMKDAVVGAVLVVALLAVGAYAGMRSPWGTKHPEVVDGMAMRANTENDLVLFDGSDGTQLTFGADRIWWESSSGEGDGNPPCLVTTPDKVAVQVGFMRVARPGGGWFERVVWVKCP